MPLGNPFKWQPHSASTRRWESPLGRGTRNNALSIKWSPDQEKFPSKLNSLQSYILFPLIFSKVFSLLSLPPPAPSLLNYICKFLPFGTVLRAMEKWCLRGERQSQPGLESIDRGNSWQHAPADSQLQGDAAAPAAAFAIWATHGNWFQMRPEPLTSHCPPPIGQGLGGQGITSSRQTPSFMETPSLLFQPQLDLICVLVVPAWWRRIRIMLFQRLAVLTLLLCLWLLNFSQNILPSRTLNVSLIM